VLEIIKYVGEVASGVMMFMHKTLFLCPSIAASVTVAATA
jgi:hypothetical protein